MVSTRVGRRWIHKFALVAKPLTMLTREDGRNFYFGDVEREAMAKLKRLMTMAPVLIVIDYEVVRKHLKTDVLPKETLDGLVVLAVDSCANGAGWILQQI